MRIGIAVVLALVLTSCKPAWKEAIEAELVDPGSAEYRNTWSGADGACGEINARNAMGGYAGFEPFAYEKLTGVVAIGFDPMRPSTARACAISPDGEACADAMKADLAAQIKTGLRFINIRISCPHNFKNPTHDLDRIEAELKDELNVLKAANEAAR